MYDISASHLQTDPPSTYKTRPTNISSHFQVWKNKEGLEQTPLRLTDVKPNRRRRKRRRQKKGDDETENTHGQLIMATSQHLLLSPAELAYLHSSLRLSPPIRPDGRTAAQFRPLTAETGILPGTNGSARVCFSDGTEAIVGVKAEVEKTRASLYGNSNSNSNSNNNNHDISVITSGSGGERRTIAVEKGEGERERERDESSEPISGDNDWVEMTVEIPGYRDDDSSTIFLATMLGEALLADGEFTKKLWINRRFHWKLYLDVSVLCCVVLCFAYVLFRSPLFQMNNC